MKLAECKVGMPVKGQNMFGLTYIITAVGKREITVEHRSGLTEMRGGKRVPEVFEYTNRPSIFTPA